MASSHPHPTHPHAPAPLSPAPHPPPLGAVRGVRVLGSPFWSRYSWGILHWLVLNAVLYLALVAQVTTFFPGIKNLFFYVAAGYAGLVVVHAVLTTRDGYTVSLTHGAARACRAAGRRSCCRGVWLALAGVLEWAGASSVRPTPKEYLAPYAMKVGGEGGGGAGVPAGELGRRWSLRGGTAGRRAAGART